MKAHNMTDAERREWARLIQENQELTRRYDFFRSIGRTEEEALRMARDKTIPA